MQVKVNSDVILKGNYSPMSNRYTYCISSKHQNTYQYIRTITSGITYLYTKRESMNQITLITGLTTLQGVIGNLFHLQGVSENINA